MGSGYQLLVEEAWELAGPFRLPTASDGILALRPLSVNQSQSAAIKLQEGQTHLIPFRPCLHDLDQVFIELLRLLRITSGVEFRNIEGDVRLQRHIVRLRCDETTSWLQDLGQAKFEIETTSLPSAR